VKLADELVSAEFDGREVFSYHVEMFNFFSLLCLHGSLAAVTYAGCWYGKTLMSRSALFFQRSFCSA